MVVKDPDLEIIRRGLRRLTQFAVEYRYPGIHANGRDAKISIKRAERIREEVRKRLGLRTS